MLPGTEAQWTRPPFGGQQAGGYLYGRGALGDKLNAIGQLEVVEHLLRTNFQPRCMVLLAFGHDKETQSQRGAAVLAAAMQQRYPQLEMVLYEGSLLKTDGVAGLTQPVALGREQKGLPQPGAAGLRPGQPLVDDAGPHQRRAGGGGTLAYLAPAVPFGKRLVFAN